MKGRGGERQRENEKASAGEVQRSQFVVIIARPILPNLIAFLNRLTILPKCVNSYCGTSPNMSLSLFRKYSLNYCKKLKTLQKRFFVRIDPCIFSWNFRKTLKNFIQKKFNLGRLKPKFLGEGSTSFL